MNFFFRSFFIITFSFKIFPVKFEPKEIHQLMNQHKKLQERKLLQDYIKTKQNPNIKIDFNGNNEYLLVYAAREGYTEELVQLLEKGADPNIGYPLYEAINDSSRNVFDEHYQCAALLLDYGADPNQSKYNEYNQKINESVIIQIIMKQNSNIFDQLGLKYVNESFRKFISKLLLRVNPYQHATSGKSIIELTEVRVKACKHPNEAEFFTYLLEQLKTITIYSPKTLKELAMRKAIQYNVYNNAKDHLPSELQQELEQYAQRKDMIHNIKRNQSV